MTIKKILIGTAAAVLALGSVGGIAFAASFSNGSFETGTYVDGGSGFQTLSSGDTTITGWTVGPGSIDWIGSYWQASNLDKSLDLNGLTQGSISQTFDTVVGGTYKVTFDLSGNPANRTDTSDPYYSSPTKVVKVSATGTASQDYSYDTIAKGNTLTDMKWENNTYTFVAFGASTTLTFASQISGAFGPALDNVVITETLPKAIATGGLNLGSPRQQISFNAFDYGDSSLDKGHVEYQNFDYPGGLHYTADVLCANVNPTTHTAWFMFQIPAGFPGLSGLYVVSYVKDLGSPGTKGDTYGHTASSSLAIAQSWCENGNAPVGLYPVTGGNAVVHK